MNESGTGLLSGAKIVTPTGIVEDAWLQVVGGRIAGIGRGNLPGGFSVAGPAPVDLDGAWVVAGFIDVHTHGGGGSTIYSGASADVRTVAATHLAHGTTTMLASIASMDLPAMELAADTIAGAIEDGTASNIEGVHFEGPFLSVECRGAQELSALRLPDSDVLRRLADAARGHARSVTVAPELPGALAIIREGAASGLTMAIGHSNATYAEFDAAIGAGAREVTHLFNGMRHFHHREAGPIAAALLRNEVACEIINDGTHVADSAIRMAFGLAGPDRIVFITDAMAAAGAPDGQYTSGHRVVTVRSSVATLSGTQVLAGSTLTMDRAFQRAINTLGLGILEASRSASATPARLLGLGHDRGTLEVGKRADLVVLDRQLSVQRVMRDGSWV
jgi:N-acetylglucosamine-6-phosphate deacetylase